MVFFKMSKLLTSIVAFVALSSLLNAAEVVGVEVINKEKPKEDTKRELGRNDDNDDDDEDSNDDDDNDRNLGSWFSKCKKCKHFAGTFGVLPSYTGPQKGTGSVQLTLGFISTTIEVQLNNLVGSKTYPAHLHCKPCSESSGGGHYQNNRNGCWAENPDDRTNVNNVNEAWPEVLTDGEGKGHGRSKNWWTPDMEKKDLSVVVHDPDRNNERLLCADLRPTCGIDCSKWRTTKKCGTFHLLPSYLANPDGSITTAGGTVELETGCRETAIFVEVNGLVVDQTYPAHLHCQPCSADGGGHYQNELKGCWAENPDDRTNVNDVNEAWPSARITCKGNGTGSSFNDWEVKRWNSQHRRSVVVHDPNAGNAKMLCADLVDDCN